MASDERAVLAANQRFYDAFAERSFEKLEALMSLEHPVAVVHPGWPALLGREAVLDSWRRILGGPSPPDIRCSQARAHVIGDAAYVICTEHLPDGDLVATNFYVREGDGWRMLHHQAGPTPVAAPDADGTRH
jgi:ketosteroid isomerase-like protein